MISRTFKLCLNAGSGSAPYINVNQYDEGETWLFELYSENGERYIPSSGAIVGVKSDGHGIVNTGTVDSEGRVVITETEQMTASAGRAIYELSIDGLTHGTANFIVAVERKPTDDAVMSDSDLSLIQEAIDSAEVIVEVIGDGDPSEVIGEHVDAWLDAHPEATTTVQDGAITAPKINQSLWDKLLVSESASGAVASFDDGADDVPVSSLKVALELVQLGSGDPSPSNIRPIIASNGKNLLPPTIYNLASNNGAVVSDSSYRSMMAEVTGGETYTISRDIISGNRFHIYGTETQPAVGVETHIIAQQNSALQITFTTAETDKYILVYLANDGSEITSKIQLEKGSATPYQPYQGIIVKRTGKNLLNKNDVQNAHIDPNGVIYNNTSWSTSQYVKINNNYKYTLSGLVDHPNTGTDNINQYDANYNLIGVKRVTAASGYPVQFDSGTEYVRFCWKKTDENTAMFAVGGDTSYEPYTGTSYPYTLGQSVYGGSVDLATGVLTLTKGFKNITASDNIQSIGSSGNGWQVLRSSFDIPPLNRGANYSDGVICDRLKSEVGASSVADDLCFINSSGVLRFNLATVYADKTELFAALGEINVAYPIEPQTINLTPTQVKTLVGYNNISSSGTVDVIYHADTKLYVDKMTAVDNNIIAPTEADFVATRNYTVNDLVIVNDTLYKVTSNIQNGGTITPNSNVQQTTLGALIKALS